MTVASPVVKTNRRYFGECGRLVLFIVDLDNKFNEGNDEHKKCHLLRKSHFASPPLPRRFFQLKEF